jgi:ubiquinone/menaquinone biosynthesis C-methylase UbiE
MTSASFTRTDYSAAFGRDAAENYQKYFVPVIGGPFALDLVHQAGLRPGERVLDVACGTGTIARLAAEAVGPTGAVSALDINPGMLKVARSLPSQIPIKWYETAAESVPLPDESFDVVFCGLGLQFLADRAAALREMRRVLTPGGRVYISTPVPSAFFDLFDRAIARHANEAASAFVHAVFSLNDPGEMESLLADAGFVNATARAHPLTVNLPSPREFMWQYIVCTPLMAVLPPSGNDRTRALEEEMVTAWQPWVAGEGMRHEQSTLVSCARREG